MIRTPVKLHSDHHWFLSFISHWNSVPKFIVYFPSLEYFKSRWYLFPKDMLWFKQGWSPGDSGGQHAAAAHCGSSRLPHLQAVSGNQCAFSMQDAALKDQNSTKGGCNEAGGSAVPRLKGWPSPLGVCIKVYLPKAQKPHCTRIFFVSFMFIFNSDFEIIPRNITRDILIDLLCRGKEIQSLIVFI